MPLLHNTTYRQRPFFLFNGHLETIIPSLFFEVDGITYDRQRMELPDGNFLDLDWLRKPGNNKLMVISHGLEGSSGRHYVRRTAKYFHELGWDILVWNCRSCSGEMNRLPKFYHHGDTEDLSAVINLALSGSAYHEVVLFGYSMGGSMIIKYLGEGRVLDIRIKGAITFSVPLNLADSGNLLKRGFNRFYEQKFLSRLKRKVAAMALLYPGTLTVENLDSIADFDVFHERYTLPLNGFSSLEAFYQSSTCDQFLVDLTVPVFVGNALNDPLLGQKCYQSNTAKNHQKFYLQTPLLGGHVGFTYRNKSYSWMEEKGAAFIRAVLISS